MIWDLDTNIACEMCGSMYPKVVPPGKTYVPEKITEPSNKVGSHVTDHSQYWALEYAIHYLTQVLVAACG